MCAKLTAARLSSSAKADDPVIAGPDERHRLGLDRPHTGYGMPAFAGMTIACFKQQQLSPQRTQLPIQNQKRFRRV
jgi:hypothetical protein